MKRFLNNNNGKGKKMKKTMMIELPKENMTNGKFRTDKKTSQVCVIPNTEDNRTSIRHINKLAKQQNSHFRLKMRYRCPKEGKNYGYGGNLPSEDARGIGIYIDGAITSCEVDDSREYWINRLKEKDGTLTLLIKKKDDEMDKVLLENLRLKEEIVTLNNEITSKNAIENLESACGEYKDENGEDDTYEKMCDMVGSLWNYDR